MELTDYPTLIICDYKYFQEIQTCFGPGVAQERFKIEKNKTGHITQKRLHSLIEGPWFVGLIFLVGIFISLHNLGERPLWRDEAWVANLASSGSFSSVFFTQWPVPPLFISSIYLSVHLFKNNEWFLRIVPALFSIGGMVLIYYSVKRFLGKIEAIGALILFVALPVLMAYSQELKQYTADIFFSLLLILIAEHIIQQRHRFSSWGMLAISGAIGLWFSYPLVFVLCSVGTILLWDIAKNISNNNIPDREKYRTVFCWVGTCSFIMFSFLILYFTVIRNQVTPGLESYWRTAFPDSGRALPFLKWLITGSWSFFVYFWNGYAPIVMFLCLVGIWELYRSNRTRIVAYWGIVFFLLLIASVLHKYPFGGNRTNLYTIPCFIILFISGIRSLWRLSTIISFLRPVAYLGLFLIPVVVADAGLYYKNNKGYFWYKQYPLVQDMKSALSILEKKRKDDEPVYIYYGGDLAFEYYSRHYYKALSISSPVFIGKMHRGNNPEYIEEIKPFIEAGRPFWLLATHAIPSELSYIHEVIQSKFGYKGDVYFIKDGAILIYYRYIQP